MTSPETRDVLSMYAKDHGLKGEDQVVFVTAVETALRCYRVDSTVTMHALWTMRERLSARIVGKTHETASNLSMGG